PPRYSHAEEKTERLQLLHDIRILHFDFDKPTSQDEGRALRDCQSLLTSGDAREMRDLWERLIGVADQKRPAGGAIDGPALRAMLRGRFQLRDHPDYRADFEALRRRAAEEMGYIETRVGGIAQLPREKDRTVIRARLAAANACLLVGESGNGKSAL